MGSSISSWAGGGKREEVLSKISQGEVVLLEAEEVAEFVEVGGADFFGKNVGIAFGQIPEVVEVEDDAWGWIGGVRVSLQTVGSFKEPKEIRFKSLVENRLVRHGLIEGDHGFRGGPEFGGKTGVDALDGFRSKAMEVGFQVVVILSGRVRKTTSGKVHGHGKGTRLRLILPP
jgi:hypothetical protein